MSAPASKAEVLERIDRERAEWERLVSEIGEDRMQQPGATGDWTFKDVVAHLSGWRSKTLSQLDAAQHGGLPTPPPWPADLDEETERGVDQINDWIYRANRDRPLHDVLAEYRQSFQRMRDAAVALSEHDLNDVGRYSWLPEQPLVAIINSSFGHFHEEHEPTLRAWLERSAR